MMVIVGLGVLIISVNNRVLGIDAAMASEYPIIEAERIAIDYNCEQTFKQPIPIDWSGRVIATFVSGEDIGVIGEKNHKFYVSAAGLYHGGEQVRVIGSLVGITCAYANTVFGECVDDVVADRIIILK